MDEEEIVEIHKEDLHPHLKARMSQRGVTQQEIQETVKLGAVAIDAKSGTLGKVMVFPYAQEWEGKFYEEKEVTVYYKMVGKQLVLLTVKARYGKGFSQR